MKKKALQAAFPQTIPIFAGFLFLGMTLGIYMVKLGFPAWIPILTSAVVFAGSVEFIAANLMLGIFNPIQAITLAIMVNARHLFYGISMLDKYRGIGKKKLYVIFGMCDETFSISCLWTAFPSTLQRPSPGPSSSSFQTPSSSVPSALAARLLPMHT